jgi:hypothetical protein
MAPPEQRSARYRMGPRSTRGLIAGWRTGQITCVAIGLVLAVGILRSIGGLEGAFLSLLLVSGAVAAATWPIGGRSVQQWVPTVATFAARAVAEGRYRPWRPARSSAPARSSSRGLLTRLSLFELGDTGIGVIGDPEAGTWSSVVPVGGAGFALLDDAERASRIAAWSGVLAAMAREGSGLHRIQWVARSYPAFLEASAPGDEVPEVGRPSALGTSGHSYSLLVEEVGPELWSHEVFIAVTVCAGPRSFSKAASVGRRSPPDAVAEPETRAAAGAGSGRTWQGDRESAPGTRQQRSRGERRPAPGTRQQRKAEARRLEEERLEAERREWRVRSGAVDPAGPSAPGRHFRQSSEPVEVVQPATHPAGAGRPEPLAPAGRRDVVLRPSGLEDITIEPGERTRRRGTDPATLLRRQLTSLVGRLEGAGLRCGQPLSTTQLAANLRRGYEAVPVSDAASWPWPVGVTESWARLRTDGTWQAAYWIAEWPRSEVGTSFMLPLLLSARIRRTVSVTMAPLPSLAAVRRAERERTSGSADAELRQRHGFAVSARAHREQEARLQREAELAEGHAGYRFSGYVTVTGHDVDDLEQACARIEQDAALAQLELRRLYGAQEEGFCCSLPIGRGCR